MFAKLILAVAAVAAVSAAHRSEARTPSDAPTSASIAVALQRTGSPATRIVDLSCERRPSALFGPEVFRCRVSAVQTAPAPVQMTLTLAPHDGGWAIVAR